MLEVVGGGFIGGAVKQETRGTVFSWMNKVQMRFDHHVSDTVVAYMLGRGRGS